MVKCVNPTNAVPLDPNAFTICLADYHKATHAHAIVDLLDAYARDPMGGGEALSAFATTNLVSALAARPQAFSVLAFADATESVPVGLINCIEGFSTFKCKPLVNVHDVVVLGEHRGKRIAQHMLDLVIQIAQQRGACKLTLEVLQGNAGAIRLYERVGFRNYKLGDLMGDAQFLQKWLE